MPILILFLRVYTLLYLCSCHSPSLVLCMYSPAVASLHTHCIVTLLFLLYILYCVYFVFVHS